MNYKILNKIILKAAKQSKYFEKDFFPKERLKTKQGRFELLALSVLDVWGYNADNLWYVVGEKLRKKNVLRIEYLENANIKKIEKELMGAGYNRGKKPLFKYSTILKNLAIKVKKEYSGDISEILNNKKDHNQENVKKIINELDKLPGVGQKIATMYMKFMISTFGIWKWSNKKSFIGISIPDDSQVRKVFLRLRDIPAKKFKNKELLEEYSKFSEKLKISFMEIDDVLWNVGRIYCSKKSPSCHYCIFGSDCHYSKLRRNGKIEQLKKIDNIIL